MANVEIPSSDAPSNDAPSSDIPTGLEANFNPYAMHHSLGATMILVNQPLLGADNYLSWKKAILIALSGKNKDGFVTGKIKKPSDERFASAWKCNNDTICSWLLNSVSKEIAASVVYSGSVKEVWDDLAEMFKASNGPRMYQLRRELATTIQGSLSVETYFMKLKTIWQNLSDFRPNIDCTCGGLKSMNQHWQSEFTTVFLMGLNDSYSTIRTQILLIEPLPPINKAYALIIQEERQRMAGQNTSLIEPVALLVSEQSKKGATSTHRRKDRPYCTHCNRLGHTIEKCYKIHGYPPGNRPRNQNPTSTDNPNAPVANTISQNETNGFLGTLNASQYAQLMSLLNSQNPNEKSATVGAVSHTPGQAEYEDDWQG